MVEFNTVDKQMYRVPYSQSYYTHFKIKAHLRIDIADEFRLYMLHVIFIYSVNIIHLHLSFNLSHISVLTIIIILSHIIDRKSTAGRS